MIELWPIDRPIDYERNARKWSASAVAKVGASIREYGWRQPVVVNSAGGIVIGHLRRTAAKAIGLTECPVHVASNLRSAQIKAPRLADNRTHDEADWIDDSIQSELLELKGMDFYLGLTGFNMREIEAFILPVNRLKTKSRPCQRFP